MKTYGEVEAQLHAFLSQNKINVKGSSPNRGNVPHVTTQKKGGESLRLSGHCVMVVKKEAEIPSENIGGNYYNMEYQSQILGILTA
jgi:hypothetical protein